MRKWALMHHFSFPTMYCICLYVCVCYHICISVCISVAFQLGKGDEEVGSNASLFPPQQCMPAGSPTYHFTWTLIMPPGPPPAHSAHKYIAEYEDKRNTKKIHCWIQRQEKYRNKRQCSLHMNTHYPPGPPPAHSARRYIAEYKHRKNTEHAWPPPIHNLQVKKNTNPKIKTKTT